MAGECHAVQEGGGALAERLHQPVADQHAAERGVAGGHALGEGDDVGLVAVTLRAEVVAQPAERADHLVGDEQHAVAVADLPDPLEVPGRRREAAAGVLHRLQEDGGHRLRALAQDGPLDLVGGPQAERGQVVGDEPRRAVEVGVRYPDPAGRQRLEWLLDRGQPGDGQRAHRGAVVGDVPAEHLVPAGLAGRLEVLLGQLPGGLHRLGAAGGEEHPVQVAGGQRRPAARPARPPAGGRRTRAGSRPARRPAARRPRRLPCGRARSG